MVNAVCSLCGKVKARKIYHEAHWVKNSYNQWVWQRAYTSKVTLYVIPVSKTGTPGKAVKKVVKLKN